MQSTSLATTTPQPSNLAALQAQFPNQSQWVGGTINSQVLNNPIVQAQRSAAQAAAIQQQVSIQVSKQIASTGTVSIPPTIRSPSKGGLTVQ